MDAPLTFLTPLFSRGAYEDAPEIRPPSIRGQLHHWVRQLGAPPPVERDIFGSVHANFGGHALKPAASRLVVRVAGLPQPGTTPGSWLPTLPHKPGGANPRNAPNAPRAALPAGTTATVQFIERLGGMSPETKSWAQRAIYAWLLAGSLGLRATRGGGSLHWEKQAPEEARYLEQLRKVLLNAPLRWALLDRVFPDAEAARRVITDTISHQALDRLGYPLGAVRQGAGDPAPARKTSPLRLTVRRFTGGFRILALWDQRAQITGNQLDQLRAAVEMMAQGTPQSRPTEIGRLLHQSTLFA